MSLKGKGRGEGHGVSDTTSLAKSVGDVDLKGLGPSDDAMRREFDFALSRFGDHLISSGFQPGDRIPIWWDDTRDLGFKGPPSMAIVLAARVAEEAQNMGLNADLVKDANGLALARKELMYRIAEAWNQAPHSVQRRFLEALTAQSNGKT
jgi:hypothetical protein